MRIFYYFSMTSWKESQTVRKGRFGISFRMIRRRNYCYRYMNLKILIILLATKIWKTNTINGFKIFWTNRASRNFDIILEYLEVEWGDQVTNRFIKDVYDFLELLVEFPELGSIENKEKGIRGFTLIKQINIFYRITSDKIIILGLFDNRQNPSKKHR